MDNVSGVVVETILLVKISHRDWYADARASEGVTDVGAPHITVYGRTPFNAEPPSLPAVPAGTPPWSLPPAPNSAAAWKLPVGLLMCREVNASAGRHVCGVTAEGCRSLRAPGKGW